MPPVVLSKMERGKMAKDIFKKGSIEMLKLLIMQEMDMGYQLVHLLKERSKGIITVQAGYLYPLPYHKVHAGYSSGITGGYFRYSN